ncbi:disease resistance protein RGA2-like [Hordeum vulgare subsp. vulgare]|uniref:NB-ARC domain-containing protein n=1 Tax=Hordeum vulgare subsp. vulgare TaxID=112509 RepID=A0A8I6W7W5_HORVV|nr:disease resistance protein RGA2-like [Hordeum vulgare subsp. vulgare]XP_044982272.1 disease resistance protein RGA2-like [Hordeum vulgare subsp. vulgare]XP_044982280.1 disease resistance protein RGA2-like [Hordeum vulgare subsp. vulgare]
MEAAVGAASSLLGKVLTKLSEDLVAAYVDSLELGHNSEQIQTKLMHTQGLLQLAEGRDASNVTALPALLEKLSNKADEAEDLLDELHYFTIQDQLDGTHYAAPDLGDGLRGHARHGLHALRYTIGNWFPCFSCSRAQDDDSAPTAVANSPHHYATNSATASADDGGHVDRLHFDRVAMSSKIKSVINDIHSLCDPVSDLLSKIPSNSTAVTLTRPHIGSTIIQDKLYGRKDIFEKIVDDITSGTHQGQTVSVLPIVGPGGIGKTTFTQHLYNDSRTQVHFTVMVWMCVSTDFDVLKLTQQIHNCIPPTENETASETANLDQLQKSIAQRLKSKRFLIVLDDIWKCNSEDEWKTLLAPFTKGEAKGSMVLVTTRFPKLAGMMKTINPVELQGLESNDFFTFFESCIFGEHKPRDYEDELGGIAREIARKLKGSPLAAKTVGRLLKKNLSREHWNGVLHNHEWQNQKNYDDIIPSLKISYHYLPFHLKKCFSYCALYPEDYRFSDSEINRFGIAIGIIDSSHPSDNDYMEGLVENGFLMKGVIDDHPYYVMHDLMHELSRSVSAQECLNISDLDFRAEAIPQSIRHISITIENRYDENFREEMGKLKGRIDIVNLRTLMIFRKYEERIIEILKDTFMETKGLRVLFIAVTSLESLPQRFSKLIHLQYLQIRSPYGTEMTLPSTLSRFYHLKFLDLISWHGSPNLPKDIGRLVNLRDFFARKELHSNVPEAGKMKYLRELKEFHVKKGSVGFDLRELGELRELGGALSIHNLENVATKEEASSAKLALKSDLKELTLVWGREHPTYTDADILDALQPHSNLTTLGIINQGGNTWPSWLCPDTRVNNLETLHLHGVSWGILPPFGQLPYLRELSLKSISGLRQFGPDYGGVRGKCLVRLKKVLFHDLSDLVRWVVEPNCHMFPSLESIDCRNCANLCVLPFSEWSCTNLCMLYVDGCPKLCLPPMPHTSTLTCFSIRNGSEMFSYHENKMVVTKYASALAFHNLGEVEDMRIEDVSHISWTDLEKLKSLRKLAVGRCDGMFCGELDGSVVFHNMDKVESLSVDVSQLTGKLLSKVFNSCPALAELEINSRDEYQEERVIQFPSSSSLQALNFSFLAGLVLLPAEDGGGLQDTTSLQSLNIMLCDRLFSRWPMGAPMTNPFPASLRKLDIWGESSIWSMALLSNLTSLTHLKLIMCDKLTVDGFNPLITVNLKELEVRNLSGNSVAADLLSEVAMAKIMQEGSFQLEKLKVDSISAVLVAPICNHLSATLHELVFSNDMREKGFTEEQENALQLLTSLRTLGFDLCEVLQCLPQGLHHLSSLKTLKVSSCPQLRLLPEQGFPTSLQFLSLGYASADQKEQAEKLKGTYPNLRVHNQAS